MSWLIVWDSKSNSSIKPIPMSVNAQQVISLFQELPPEEKLEVAAYTEEWEDQQDSRLIRDTLANSKDEDFISWEQVKRDLDADTK